MTRSVAKYSVALAVLALLLGTVCDSLLPPAPPSAPGDGLKLDFEKIATPKL